MTLRKIGKSELEIPAIVLGGMFRDPSSRTAELERALDCALDVGLFAIDTAPLYEFGESESLLGRFLKGRRARTCLMTKVGLRWDDDWGEILFAAHHSGRPIVVRRDSRPEAVRRDVEESLVRLRTESLDLVQVHHRDPGTPIDETMGALTRLRSEGKLRAIGVSNFTPAELIEAQLALGELPLASTQNDFSLIERSAENELLPTARKIGASLLAYSPLAQGILAGRLLGGDLPADDGRMGNPLYQSRNARRINHVLRSVVAPLAESHEAGLAEVALGWIIAQPGVCAAIVGAQTEAQVRTAAAAAKIELSAAEVDQLGRAFMELPLDRSAGISFQRRFLNRARRLARRVLRGSDRSSGT